MALPEKHELLPDLLYLFVLGPCKGETVLLRVPPGHWMVIDSFKAGRSRRPAAEPIITRYGGRVEVLALTLARCKVGLERSCRRDAEMPVVMRQGLRGPPPTQARKRDSPLATFGVALFCCPEGAETGKPRAMPWGSDPNENSPSPERAKQDS